jgi:hypothetical protein
MHMLTERSSHVVVAERVFVCTVGGIGRADGYSLCLLGKTRLVSIVLRRTDVSSCRCVGELSLQWQS